MEELLDESWKRTLLDFCEEQLNERIRSAETAMKAAQEGANEEEKSSAGDKYETARAMGQIAYNMNARQLQLALQELAGLKRIGVAVHENIGLGSLAETTNGVYFIACGLGQVEVGGKHFLILSPGSPIATLLIGKKAGDSFTFNGKDLSVTRVW